MGGHQIQQAFAISVGNVNEAPMSLSLATDSTQLLVNGSFEANELNNGQWSLFSGIDGWKTSTQVEIQNNVTNKASDGAQVVEMDADNKVDNVYQDVQTVAGHAYELTFDTATRNDTKHDRHDRGLLERREDRHGRSAVHHLAVQQRSRSSAPAATTVWSSARSAATTTITAACSTTSRSRAWAPPCRRTSAAW